MNATGATQARENQVADQLNRLTRAHETLHKELSMLESRLEPLLRSIPPSPNAPEGKTAVQLVSLAARIADSAEAIERARAYIETIQSRLEI